MLATYTHTHTQLCVYTCMRNHTLMQNFLNLLTTGGRERGGTRLLMLPSKPDATLKSQFIPEKSHKCLQIWREANSIINLFSFSD